MNISGNQSYSNPVNPNGCRDRGVLYVATGLKFYEEAIESATSLRKSNPGLPLAVYTDQEIRQGDPFDIKVGSPPFVYGFGEKISALLQSPFGDTVFLDTDTFVIANIADLFEILERFSLAVARDPSREWQGYREEDIPECFSEFNTGVIVFRKQDSVTDLFLNWQALYFQEENLGRYPHDQPTFRRALYRSKVEFFVLSPEYNARIIYPIMLASQVKIVHARCRNLHRMGAILNRDCKPRIFTWSIRDIFKILIDFVKMRIGRGW